MTTIIYLMSNDNVATVFGKNAFEEAAKLEEKGYSIVSKKEYAAQYLMIKHRWKRERANFIADMKGEKQ